MSVTVGARQSLSDLFVTTPERWISCGKAGYWGDYRSLPQTHQYVNLGDGTYVMVADIRANPSLTRAMKSFNCDEDPVTTSHRRRLAACQWSVFGCTERFDRTLLLETMSQLI